MKLAIFFYVCAAADLLISFLMDLPPVARTVLVVACFGFVSAGTMQLRLSQKRPA